MIGLAWFAIVVTYIIISYKAVVISVRFVKTKTKKVVVACIVVVAAMAFPIGDPLYSYFIYNKYCIENAGGRIYGALINVDRVALDPFAASFMIPYEENSSRSLAASLGRYRNIEEVVSGEIYQYEPPYKSFAHGKKIRHSLSTNYISLSTTEDNRIYIVQEFKITKNNGEILGVFRFVGWHGGGFTGPIFNFETSGYGPPQDIKPPRADVVQFIYDTLVPSE